MAARLTNPRSPCCIDVINDLEFPESQRLFRFALPMAKRIAKLSKQARSAGVPVIYINDNFGR